MYICVCNGVTEHDIRQCAESGVCTFSALQGELGVGAGCGQCRKEVKNILRDLRLDGVQGAAVPA